MTQKELIYLIGHASLALKECADALGTRDLEEDPIGYCINRDGIMDLTCASKYIEIVKSIAFAENKWHPNRSIVVPIFARPGAG